MTAAMMPAPSNTRSATRADGNHEKFLTFRLGKEEYGFPILVVREIIGIIDVTPLPQTPAYVKGVINLRGKIIPVIELRLKFGLPAVAYTPQTCIVVVEVTGADGHGGSQLGVIVDAVSEVLDIAKSHVEPPPSFGASIPLGFIEGMGKIKDKVVILLNIGSVGTADELEKVQVAAKSSADSAGARGPRATAA